MRATILVLVFTALSTFNGQSQDRTITFSGQVSEGQPFSRSIGHGLDFVLTPASMGDDITGWTIEVSPQGEPPAPECNHFAWVVTPPYRFGNARYIDTQYGTTAQEAVRISPREFSFVLNCADLKAERQRVDRVLWPYTFSKEEVDEAMAKLGSSPLGTGKLWIRRYRITPGKKTETGVNLGAIHWIKFKVEIKFPAGGKEQAKP